MFCSFFNLLLKIEEKREYLFSEQDDHCEMVRNPMLSLPLIKIVPRFQITQEEGRGCWSLDEHVVGGQV